MQRLATAPSETQAALQNCTLPASHHYAIPHVPAHRQVELVGAAQETYQAEGLPLLALQAAVYTLEDEHTAEISAAAVLNAAITAYRKQPRLRPRELSVIVLLQLTQITEEAKLEITIQHLQREFE